MSCFSRTASFSAASHFFRHSSCCDTNLTNSRKEKESKGITYNHERRNATNNKSQYKPPSIPSARTDAERTISSKVPTSVATDIIDFFQKLEWCYRRKNLKEKLLQRKPPSQLGHLVRFFPPLLSNMRQPIKSRLLYGSRVLFGDTTGQRPQAQSLKLMAPEVRSQTVCL